MVAYILNNMDNPQIYIKDVVQLKKSCITDGFMHRPDDSFRVTDIEQKGKDTVVFGITSKNKRVITTLDNIKK